MLRNLFVDRLSFWIGVIAGILTWAAYRNGHPLFTILWQVLRRNLAYFRSKLSTSAEGRYRKDVMDLMQANHLAAPLFSLTEIAVEPRVLAPPFPIIPNGDIPPDNITSMTIPYMPDFPEIGAIFGADTLSLPEVLSGGRNLLILGKPGIGKTFALSHLAYHVARRAPTLGNLKYLIPIYVRAGDLVLPAKEDNLTGPLYTALAEKVSAIVEAQLPSLLDSIFKAKLALLIIDDLDELPPENLKSYADYLTALQKTYPGNRYIAAGAPESALFVDALNFFPVSLAAWEHKQTTDFFHKWANLWHKLALKESWAKPLPKNLDPLVLHSWLSGDTKGTNPIMATLNVWGYYAGDLAGPNAKDALEAYINRMTAGISKALPALEQLALQSTLSQAPIITRKAAGEFVSSFEEDINGDENKGPFDNLPASSTQSPIITDEDFDSLLDELDSFSPPPITPRNEEDTQLIPRSASQEMGVRAVRRIIPDLVNSGIIAARGKDSITFSHPIIRGYLAGRGFAARGGAEGLLTQPSWSGRSLALEFLAVNGDISPVANGLMQEDRQDPLRRGLVQIGAWPRHAPQSAPWRNNILRRMAGILQYDTLPMGLRTRVLASLAFSGEAGIGSLFRQLLDTRHPSVRTLGAIGSGIIKDAKAVPEIGSLLQDPDLSVCRAACLALATIATPQAVDLLANALLHGSEEVRRSAAEALARCPEEGYPLLKEGAAMRELLVRRAVVYGLARIEEPWALELLDHLQLEDDEWIVRNAANQTLENKKKGSKPIPGALPPIHEIPWLVTFASKKGVGISPGQASIEMLIRAVQEGNEEHKLAAMDIFRQIPQKANGVLPDLYQLLSDLDHEIREAAFNTVWHIGAAGVPLPPVEG